MTRGPNGRLFKQVLALLLVDALFFSLVNPTANNSFLVVVGSLLLGVTFYLLLRGCIRALAHIVNFTDATQKRLAAFAAALLMFLLLMQSVGQLSRRDVIAVIVLTVILYFYTSYLSEGEGRDQTKQTRADHN